MVINVGYIDVGANMAELQFDGIYNGVPFHDRDHDYVLERAWKFGLEKVIILGSTLRQSRKAFEIGREDDRVFYTVANQPTCLNAYQDQEGPEKYRYMVLNQLRNNADKAVALGRFGLDFSKDALNECPKGVQIAYLKEHLNMSVETGFPVIIFCRPTATKDMLHILQQYQGKLRGLVYSFDGTLEEAEKYINLGLHIGISGCSLKTKKNIEVVKALPLKRMMFGTDCPSCNIKPGHPGHSFIKTHFPTAKKLFWTKEGLVTGRNEPCKLIQVLEVVAGARNLKPEFLGVLGRMNTEEVFFDFDKRHLPKKCDCD